MIEILVGGLVVLALIGIRIAVMLGRACVLLEEIRENLPDRNFKSYDEESGQTYEDAGGFWEEMRLSMNRIARIYDKFVLGTDYLAESEKLREKWANRAGSSSDTGS